MADFKTGRGVILKLSPVSPYLINDRMRRFPARPKPPKVMIEEKGRTQENPNDPTYLEELDRWEQNRQDAIMNIVIGIGTEVESLPDGFPDAAGTDWAERIKLLTGLEIAENGLFRYIAWVKYQAIATANDLERLTVALRELAGTPEEAVAEAAESFRSEPDGNPNRATRRRAARENRDPV